MPLASFAQLFADADRTRPALPVAAVGGADRTVLEALRAACDRGWVDPYVAGRERDIRGVAAEHGISLDGFTLLDTDDPAGAAVSLVRQGRAQLVMKGQIATPGLMHALLHAETGLRTGQTIGQIVLLELRSGRRWLLADTGICIQPTLHQKEELLHSAVAVAQALGCDRPRVALLAATESVTEAMPETLDAAQLQRRGESGALGACDVQGPLSFDLAVAPDAADRKRLAGPVVGAADVLLFPSLLAANLTVKALMYCADCQFGGVLCGVRCPVAFMSRADSTGTRLSSLALALKLAGR